jgi:hypothetical protein
VLSVSPGEMFDQSLCPLADTLGLRIAHTAIEVNHSFANEGSYIEQG